ncbi:hypothetical protein ACSMXN_07875 [Jatrophihabitans sp. DSM 45814]
MDKTNAFAAAIGGVVRRLWPVPICMRKWLLRSCAGHPVYVWLLWGSAAIVMLTCPMLLADPVMLALALDPELLALIVVVGARYSHLQLLQGALIVRRGKAGYSAVPRALKHCIRE